MHPIGTWIEVDEYGVSWEVKSYVLGEGTKYEHNCVDYRQLPVVIENFCCPIPGCESTRYEPVYSYGSDSSLSPRAEIDVKDVLIGPLQLGLTAKKTYQRIAEYVCSGCSIRFDDPRKFNLNKPSEVVPPKSTPKPPPLHEGYDKIVQADTKKKDDLTGGRGIH